MILTRVSETTVIEGDPSPLWAILRDFSNVARWHPDVKDCVIEDGGPGDRVGAVRAIHLTTGMLIREKVTAISDKDMTYSYSVIESPFPLAYHTSTVSLARVDAADRTAVTWSAEFSLREGDPGQVATSIRQSVIFLGFEGLRTLASALSYGTSPGP